MTAFVRQERPTFCFLACLASFLTENGRPTTQNEILARAADVLGSNENDRGAFAAKNFPRIADEFSLKIEPIDGVGATVPERESVFAVTFWEGRADSVHWVRVLDADEKFCRLMNPASDDRPYSIETPRFQEWVQGLFLLRIGCVGADGGHTPPDAGP